MSGKTPITGLRRWLKQNPTPHSIRCDGKNVLKIQNHSSRWAEAEQSIVAMGCAIVEALAADGEVLRAFSIREPEEEREPSQKEEWPASDDAQMAKVITAACDRAATRHETIFKYSFDKLEAMYTAQSLRLEEAQTRCARLEAALFRAYEKIANYEAERDDAPDAEGTSAEVLLGQVLAGAASKVMGAGNGASNGAKT